MGQFDGKTAVITGGSSGIGLATAVRLAADGAHVFITGRRKTELDAAVETIGADRATAVVGDIADQADLDRLYEAVRARGRGLDVLFANAGSGAFATLEETTEDHFDQIFGVNVRGTVFTVQKALPLLNDGASVVVNTSVRADDGVEAFGTYAATKAAVRSGVPLGRVGRPEEVAEVVAFLASARSSFVLGVNWHVDGGENQL